MAAEVNAAIAAELRRVADWKLAEQGAGSMDARFSERQVEALLERADELEDRS